MNNYFPERVHLEVIDGELCLIDHYLNGYESAILCRFGHKHTDLSDNMLNEFAQEIMVFINQKGDKKLNEI